VSAPRVQRGPSLGAREREGDGLILTSGLTTEQARSASLSLGDEAIAALETLAQRRRLSFRKAGDTQGVNNLVIDQGLINADRCTVAVGVKFAAGGALPSEA
jgi:hypothetical protein